MNAQNLALLDLALKGAAVLLLGFGIAALLRRTSAAQRSLAWLAVFGVLLLLPITVCIKPVWSVPVVTVKQIAPPLSQVGKPIVAHADTVAGVSTSEQSFKVESTWSALQILSALYVAGLLSVLGFRFIGTWQLRLLVRCRARETGHSCPVFAAAQECAASLPSHTGRSLERIRPLVAELRRVHRIGRPITTIVSDSVKIPMTWGTLKPVLLLPADCSQWWDADLRAALEHELAHIAHQDAARRWLGTLVCALWWPQPLVWLAARAWRLEQERACDDAVVRSGANPECYAAQLLDAARAVRLGGFQSAAALVMAVPSGLDTRLRAVTDRSTDRSATGLAARFIAIGFAIVLIAGCIAVAANAAESGGVEHLILVRTKFVDIKDGNAVLDLPVLKQIANGKSVTMSDAVMEDLMRQLSQKKGVDLMSAPSVTTRSGQKATVEIVREFIYPTEFRVGGKNEGKVKQAKDENTSAITPITFEMKPVGAITEVNPVWRADGVVEFATLTAKVNEFDGFVKCGMANLERNEKGVWRIKIGVTAPGTRRLLTTEMPADQTAWVFSQGQFADTASKFAIKDGEVSAPVFSTHEWTGKPTLKLGEWLVVPLDFKSGEKALHEKRHLFCCVTAEEARPEQPKAEPPNEPKSKEPTLLQKARRIILPQVEFQRASLVEAVKFLRAKSRDLDPAKEGINIILRNDSPSKAEITLSLRDVPLNEALRYVSELSGMALVWEEYVAVISPIGEPEGMEMFTRVYQAPSALMGSETDAKKWLAAKSVAFAEGAAATFDASSSKLIVKNVPQELRKVEVILQRQGIAKEPPKPEIVQRADKIVFPSVSFHDAKLAEAVEFFRVKSRALDPEKKGVNIVLKDGAEKSDARLTLDLKNMPLSEVLRYVAQLAGLNLMVGNDAFVIAPWVPPAR